METKQIVVRSIPIDLWKQLKIRAVEDDRTLADALIQAIQAYLNRAA